MNRLLDLLVDDDHPYLGPASFGVDHGRFFKGRDAEAEELFERVSASTLTVLYGKSGLGKTSLVQARLIPKLRETSYFPILVRLNLNEAKLDLIAQIKTRVAEVIVEQGVDAPPPAQETLWRYFHVTSFWSAKNRLIKPVLVFDQFEEVFTHGKGRPEVDALWVALADLVENRIPQVEREAIEAGNAELPERYDRSACKVLIAQREDYLADLDERCDLVPSMMAGRYRLKPMNGSNALDAVLKPAEPRKLLGEGDVAKKLAEKVVRLVAAKGKQAPKGEAGELRKLELEPALLSLMCQKLNEQRLQRRERAITEALFVAKSSQVWEDFYKSRIEMLGQDGPKVRTFIEEKLLDKGGFRALYAEEDALKEPGVSDKAIAMLVDGRLLRKQSYANRPHIEIIHDVMTETIANSRAERLKNEANEQRRREAARRLRRRGGVAALIALMCAIGIGLLVRRMANERDRKSNEDREKAAKTAEMDLFTDIAATPAIQSNPSAQLQLIQYANKKLEAPRSPTLGLITSRTVQGTRGLQKIVNLSSISAIRTLQYAPGGDRFATVGIDGTVTLWNATSLDRLRILPTTGATKSVRAVTFDSTGERLAGLSGDGKGVIWSANDGQVLCELDFESSGLWAMAFKPNGSHLVAWGGGVAKAVMLKEEKGKLSAEPPSLVGQAQSISFLPEERAIVRDSYNAWIWDPLSKDMRPLVEKGFGRARVTAAATGESGGGLIAIAHSDGTIHVWRGDELSTLEQGDEVRQLSFSPNGERLAVITSSKKIVVWDLFEARKLVTISAEGEPSRAILSADGAGLVTLDSLRAQIWRVMDGVLVATVPYAGEMSIAPDGKTAIAINEGSLWRWDLASELSDQHERILSVERLIQREDARNEPQNVTSFKAWRFSSDGRWLAVASPEALAMIKTAPTPLTEQSEVKLGDARILAVSPEGEHVVGASSFGGKLWLLNARDPKFSVDLPSGGWVTPSFSPDGRWLATNSMSKGEPVCLMDLRESKPQCRDIADTSDALRVAWSAEPLRLAISDYRGGVTIVDVVDGAEKPPQSKGPIRTALKAHSGAMFIVSLSPAGDKLLTAARENEARLWRVNEKEEPFRSLQHDSRINDARFSPTGGKIITASADRTAKVWDDKGTLFCDLRGHREGVQGAWINADDTMALTLSGDVARLWDVSRLGRCSPLNRWGAVRDARFSADGAKVVLISTSNQVKMEVAERSATDMIVSSGGLIVRPDQRVLWTMDDDGRPMARDCNSGDIVPQRALSSVDPRGGRLVQVGPWVVRAGPRGPVVLLDEKGGERRSPDEQAGRVAAAAADKAGKRLIVVRDRGWVEERETVSLAITRRWTLPYQVNRTGTLAAAIHEGESYVLIAEDDDNAKDRSKVVLATATEVRALDNLDAHPKPISLVTTSADGGAFVLGSQDGAATLWRTKELKPIRLPKHTTPVTAAAFSPDGAFVLTASEDGAIWISRMSDGKPLTRLYGHAEAVRFAMFDPEGDHAITADAGGVVRLWDTRHTRASLCEVRKLLSGIEWLDAPRDVSELPKQPTPPPPAIPLR